MIFLEKQDCKAKVIKVVDWKKTSMPMNYPFLKAVHCGQGHTFSNCNLNFDSTPMCTVHEAIERADHRQRHLP